MPESMTISLPGDMSIIDQVTEVNKQIAEWIETLDKPFNDELDVFQLTGCEKDGSQNTYHYVISRDAKSPKRKR